MQIDAGNNAINFSRKLETESAAFYEAAADRFAADAEIFAALAKENKGFIDQIERANYGVIIDSIKGCFSFDIETDGYELGDAFSGSTGRTEAFKMAIEMEEKIIVFYTVAAEQSRHLVADVAESFDMVVKRRSERISMLKALL